MRLRRRERVPVPDETCYRCVRRFSRRRPQVVTVGVTMARDAGFMAGPLCRRCFLELPSAAARLAFYPDYVRDRRLALIARGVDPERFDPRELDSFRFAAATGKLSPEALAA